MISCDVKHQEETESLIMPHSPRLGRVTGHVGREDEGENGGGGRGPGVGGLITAAINRKEPRVALLSFSASYQLPGRRNVTFSLRAAR